MPLSVEKLMNLLSPAYNIRLVAGEGGIEQTNIEWVSIVEDYDTERFGRQGRLVITSGMKYVNDDIENVLTGLINGLIKAKGKALIINTGKYIREIPGSIIDYCDQKKLPLYTMSSEFYMNDVVKDIAELIIRDEEKFTNLGSFMRSILFDTESLSSNIKKLALYNLSIDDFFCPMIFSIKNEDYKENTNIVINRVNMLCKEFMEHQSAYFKYVCFQYENMVIVIVIYKYEDTCNKYIQHIQYHMLDMLSGNKMYIYIGHMQDSIHKISDNFKQLLTIKNAIKPEKPVIIYDQLIFQRLLTNVSDPQFLTDLYNNSLGKLKKYDKEFHTELAACIAAYLECGANIKETSNKLYVHRNTINNYFKKITGITGINPLTLEGKLIFFVAMKTEELFITPQ